MSSVHYHMSFRCKRDGVVNVWGLVASKPHLVVEVTEKRTPKHRQLCEEVLMEIKTNQISISSAKKMMVALMTKHKIPRVVPGTNTSL